MILRGLNPYCRVLFMSISKAPLRVELLTQEDAVKLRERCAKYLTQVFTYRKTRSDRSTSGIWFGGTNKNRALLENCLPGHLMILPDVKELEKFERVELIIGKLGTEEEIATLNVRQLKLAFTDGIWAHDKNIFDKTGFHAWLHVYMDENEWDVIDIIGPVNLANKKGEDVSLPPKILYFDKQTAAKQGLYYLPVLTDKEEVFEFHSKLAFSQQLTDRTGAMQAISYLLKLAHHLGEAEDTVLGSEGNALLSIVSPWAPRGQRVLINHLSKFHQAVIRMLGAKLEK